MDWLAPATAQVERIFRAARRVAPNDEAAWDCVQEAFATALECPREPDDPVAWLCGVARNHARHHVRARSRWTAALRRLAERPARRLPEPSHDLHDALGRLPLRLRDAVTLRYLANMTFGEVARAQGISETAAKARTRRGLARLRQLLGASALTAMLAQEAVAARRNASALTQAALVAPLGGLVMKKWILTLIALVCVLGTALVWRAAPKPASSRGFDARGEHALPAPAVAPPADATRDPSARGPSDGAVARARFPANRPVVALRGSVVDHLRRPADGARVRIHTDRGGMLPDWEFDDDRDTGTLSLLTGPNGAFAVELPAGPYRISASSNDRRTQQRIAAGSTHRPLVLVLPELADTIAVLVIDSSGAAVPGARLEIVAGVPGEGVRTIKGTTNEEGCYALRSTPIGAALVQARTEDGRAGWVSVELAHEREPGVPFVLTVDASGSLEGRLVGVEPALLEGAHLIAWALTHTHPYYRALGVASSTTVKNDAYRFDALAPGTYVLTLDAPYGARIATGPCRWGGSPMENSIDPMLAEVRAAETAILDLDLAPGAALEGVVVREDGSPVADALVHVTFAPRNSNLADGNVMEGVHVWRFDSDLETATDHPTSNWRLRTDARGRYRLPGLPPGRQRVEVFAPGLAYDRREEVAVAEGRVTRLEHRLAPAGVLQLALPEHGLSRFSLVREGSDRPVLLAITAGRDAVTLPGLPAGRYRAGTFRLDAAKDLDIEFGEYEIRAGRTTWCDLRDAGPHVIRGHVTDPAGPVAGVRIRGYGATDVETDADGAFELRSYVRAGAAVALEVEEGPFRQSFTFPARNSGPTESEIALTGHTLVVRTVDAAGEPARARLTVRAQMRGFHPAYLPIAGEVTIPHVREGGYRFRAKFEGGGEATAEADVPEIRTVVLREPPSGRMEVRVEGAAPDVVVAVHAHRPAGPHGEAAADLGSLEAAVGTKGRVVFPRFPAGTIQISLQPRVGREERPIRSRLDLGSPKVYHTVELEPGATLRLTLAVDS